MQQISDSERVPETIETQPPTSSAQPRLEWLRRLSPALRQTCLLFGVTHLLFICVTYFGYVLFNAHAYSSASVGVGNLFASWDRWDALRYLEIAQHGYYNPIQTAFFPLYPLLIHLSASAFGSTAIYYSIGLLISQVASFFVLWLLRLLAERECGPEAASRATVYLALFPMALFFFAPYNESLFLLLTLGCFLALRQERWWVTGGLGFLAALTRSAGIFLLVPCAVEYLSRHHWHWRQMRVDVLALGMTPLGTALYGWYCWVRFGDPLAFAHAQSHWGRALAWPWSGLWNQFNSLSEAQPASFFQAHDLIDLAATVLMIILVALGWRRLPQVYNVYATVLLVNFLLFPLDFGDPLASNQRFALEVFPAFLTLGLLVRRPSTHQAIIIFFSGLLALFSLVFITGRWLV